MKRPRGFPGGAFGVLCKRSLRARLQGPWGLGLERLFDRAANHGARNVAESTFPVKEKLGYFRPWGVMSPVCQASINRTKSATERHTRTVRARASFFESPFPRDR